MHTVVRACYAAHICDCSLQRADSENSLAAQFIFLSRLHVRRDAQCANLLPEAQCAAYFECIAHSACPAHSTCSANSESSDFNDFSDMHFLQSPSSMDINMGLYMFLHATHILKAPAYGYVTCCTHVIGKTPCKLVTWQVRLFPNAQVAVVKSAQLWL